MPKRIITLTAIFVMLGLLLAMSPGTLEYNDRFLRAGFNAQDSVIILRSVKDAETLISGIGQADSTNTKMEIALLKSYDSRFFKDKSVLLLTLQAASGSIRHRVEDVTKDNGLTVIIERIIPEVGTMDIAIWHAYVELDKKELARIRPDNVNIEYRDIYRK